jgi:3-isopropylmalate/(R)-2-methylmalate dehydratase small subunit
LKIKNLKLKKEKNMSSMILKGKVHKFGSNVNTDEIIPARYLNTSDPNELAKHCMEDIDKEFINKKQAGDIIAAQDNFGCGSSREHAPIALKAAGISAVIAASFARIFFRNSINIGLPILESPQAAEYIENGDEIEIDLSSGVIKNITKSESYPFQKYPDFMQKIISAGGLLNYIQK